MTIGLARFPVFELELLRLARKRSLYGNRIGITVLMFILLAFGSGIGMFDGSGPEQLGRYIESFCTVILFGAAIIGPLLRAPDAFIEERSEGTLGLIIITNVSCLDMVLAKIATYFLETEMLLLGVLPILSFAAIFGGISVPAAAATFALLSVWCLFATAVGVMWSTFSGSSANSRVFTIFSLGVLWIASTVVTSLNLIPGVIYINPLTAAGDTGLPGWALSDALVAFILPLLFIPVLLLVARWRLSRHIAMDSNLTTTPTPSAYNVADRKYKPYENKRPMEALLNGSANPVGFRSASLPIKILAIPMIAGFGLVPGLGLLLLSLTLYGEISNSLAAMRKSGAYQEVLLLPLSDSQLRWNVLAALARSGWPYGLGFVAAMVINVIIAIFIGVSPGGVHMFWPFLVILPIVAQYMLIIVLGCHYGMNDGIRRRTGAYVYLGVLFSSSMLAAMFSQSVGQAMGNPLSAQGMFGGGLAGGLYSLTKSALYLGVAGWIFAGLKEKLRSGYEEESRLSARQAAQLRRVTRRARRTGAK